MKILKQLTRKMKFEIRNLKLVSFLILLTLTFFAVPKISAEVLIDDNFNISSGAGGDINFDNNLPSRQSGTLAPGFGYSWWPGGGVPTVTNAGEFAGKCRLKQSVFSPLHNFTDSGYLCIEYDITRMTNTSWTSLQFGKKYYWQAPWTDDGISVILYTNQETYHRDGFYQIWDWKNAGGPTSTFYNAELAFTSNKTINVKVCISQPGYPSTNGTRFSLFINNVPYPMMGDENNAQFLYTHLDGLLNNILSFSCDSYDGLNNFKVYTLSTNTISTASWTGDGNSGIGSSKLYTHAVNFGEFGDSVINGVTFTGSGSNDFGDNWFIRTAASNHPLVGPVSSYAEGKNPSVSGTSLGLVSNFLKSASSDDAGGLVLSGLTPGLNYKVSLYGFGFEAANGRKSDFATSDAIKFQTLDQDEFGENGGQLLTYKYTAPADGKFSFSTTPIATNVPAWNWFAFCNEILPPDAPASISATEGVYSNKIEVAWSTADGMEYYTLYRAESSDISATNFGMQLVLNSYDDVIPAVTYAQDYYYWVQACNTGGSSVLTGPAFGFTKSENPPDAPNAISPDSLNIVTSPVKFVASNYNDNGGFAFEASQWQVSESPGFSPLKWDSGETAPPTNFIFAPRNKINSGTNFWRVRYMNDRNTWSGWSDSDEFICVAGDQQSGIFKDNFNVLPTGDVNTDYAVLGRQSGTISPLVYTVSGTTEVGAGSSYPGELLLDQNAGCSPNASFESSDKFNIEFDVKLHNFDASTDWLSLSLGKDDQSSLLPDSDSGLGAVFDADGVFKFYDGTRLLHSEVNAFPAYDKCHVLITTSTEEFDEGEPAYCSVFVNGTPMINNDAFNKYAYTLNGGFEKNYVTLFNYNSAGISPSLIDNLKISHAPTNVVTVHSWTGDTDSLIDPIKEYTHLVNISGDDVTINSQDFIGTGILTNQGFGNGDPHYTTSTWALIDAGNYLVAWTQDPPPTPVLSDDSFVLGQFGVIGGGSPAVVLSGLTPNSSNTLYLYSWAREDSTEITFPSSYGGAVEMIDVDQYGQLNGMIIQYDYIADENGKFTVAATPEIDSLRFFICGFANLETGTQDPEISVDNMLAFGETALKILPLEIANIGGGIVDGIISGIEEPFSLATNNYYAVPGTNDTISVTFSPIEERAYTNVITLTGNGGSAQVTLYGDGIPEPCLFWILNLGFWIIYSRRPLGPGSSLSL